MLQPRKWIRVVPVTVAIIVVTGNVRATNESHATVAEALLLPRYCWSQYMANMKGPQYEIQECGVGMNHYCDGLVELRRARKASAPRGERIGHLKVAKHDAEYTIRWMKDYPSCPIRNDVEATLREVEVGLRLYGAP